MPLITLEGPEGGGKTTLITTLVATLTAHGHTVTRTREPGGSPLGVEIRKWLLEGEAIPPMAEIFLFLADRAHHVSTVIRPALSRGEIVICDRFTDSTLVYQGHARGHDLARLRAWNEAATEGLEPDLTLLLDLPVEIGLGRQTEKDRLDREPIEFHERVRQGFRQEATREPLRWLVLDATQSPEVLAGEALRAIADRLPKLMN